MLNMQSAFRGDLFLFFSDTKERIMQDIFTEIEQILILLAETPRRLEALTNGLIPAQLHMKLDEGSWSANDILAHLRSCADIWGKSILTMLAQDTPILRYISPRTWMKKTDYAEQSFHISFESFANQRNDLLAVLKPLALEDWSRRALFTGTVKGREQTVLTYARRIVDHEIVHLAQMKSVLKTIQG